MKTITTTLLLLLHLHLMAQTDTVPQKKTPIYGSYTTLNSSTLKLANEGNVKAMYKLGIVYKHNENYSEALKWFQKAVDNGYSRALNSLGLMYKKGEGTHINYEKAYECFTKTADKNDPYGEYLKGYMLFKGLGCQQNYEQAYRLFRKNAVKGKASYPGKMYMLGICLRNGYGTPVNMDSAKYWLTRSAALGFKFSIDELMSNEPENPENASITSQKIKKGIAEMAQVRPPINEYTAVKHNMPASDIEGEYQGYLIHYDWSGKYIIKMTTLSLEIAYKDDKITGVWKENENNIPFNAHLTKNGLLFNSMQYAKTDHYSPLTSVLFNFESANAKLVKIGDSSYLHGNLHLYSPDRKEPEKPIEISLVKTRSSKNNSTISFTNDEGANEKIPLLKSYPNPFTDVFTVEFSVKQKSIVYTQIITMDGKVVFTTNAKTLEAGSYLLTLKPSISAGTYLVKIMTGKETRTAKIVKL